MCFNGKISASVDRVSGKPHSSVLGSLLFILYSSELLHIVGIHIVYFADDTRIHAGSLRPLSRPQVMEPLNQDSVAINS